MAHGGGRGWFHRRKPQPEPQPAREPEPTRLEAFEAKQVAQATTNGEPPPVPTAPPAPSDFDALVRPPQSPPAGESPRPVTDRTHAPRDDASAPARDLGDERFAPPRPAASAIPSEPAGEASGDERRANPGTRPEADRRTSGFDWDAATAAALSDDTRPSEPTASAHPLPHSDPDRLLEDIIREIVGDATAETVSSLHQPKQDATPEPRREPVPRADSPVAGGVAIADATPAPDTGATDHDVSADHVTYTVFDEPVVTESVPGPSAAPDAREADPASELQVEEAPAEPQPAALAYSPTSTQSTVAEPPAGVSRETPESYGGTPLADQIADETRRRLALDQAVLPLPASTRILTISNQKGGVGKTTSAVNLAAALARAGAHVLVIDLDPQGNASTALGVEHRSDQQSVYEVLVSDLAIAEVVRPSTEHENLDCVPATIHLAGAEIELVSLVAREQRLRRALDAHLAQMQTPYDYVFIDCPPSLGLLTINAFVAAREVLIPIQCEYYALEGLSQLLSNIELIERHLNPDLRLSTILLTMYDSRTNLAQQVAQEVRDHFPTQTLGTIIPRSVRVSEAPSYGQSVISYDFTSSGSLSYREAAAEIAWRGASEQKESD